MAEVAERLTEFLEPQELRQLTGCRALDDQVRFLEAEGLPFRRRGRAILVSRVHMREWLRGDLTPAARGSGFRLDLVR